MSTFTIAFLVVLAGLVMLTQYRPDYQPYVVTAIVCITALRIICMVFIAY